MNLSPSVLLRSLNCLNRIVSPTTHLLRDRFCNSRHHSLRFNSSGMELGLVVDRLQKYANPNLAASWDNVGLLVEPSAPHHVSRMLLTNDLTQDVLSEAVKLKVDMIISYHPPIFQPVKRLTQKSWKERVLVQCLENRIAVYSPHTSYDVLSNGINDWLGAAFAGKSEPILQSSDQSSSSEFGVSVKFLDGLPECIEGELIKAIPGVLVSGHHRLDSQLDDSGVCMKLTCTKKLLPQVISFFEPCKQSSLEIIELVKPPLLGHGYGRLISLDKPMTIQDAVRLIKSHLKLIFVRLAVGHGKTPGSEVQSIALCAGSGSSVLRGVKADLYLTGEMSHHEVLDAVENGTSVVLCDHSNTERGFLAVLRQTLDVLFENRINIQISAVDRDPLEIV